MDIIRLLNVLSVWVNKIYNYSDKDLLQLHMEKHDL